MANPDQRLAAVAGEPASGWTAGEPASGWTAGDAALDRQFDLDSLHALRSAVTACGGAFGADEAVLDKLMIIASELATNAIRHGGGRGRLRLWNADHTVVCEVSDDGRGITDPDLGFASVESTAVGGRGLWICRHLADELTIRPGGPGAQVTAFVALTATDPVLGPGR